jgi:hypothetical protein
MFAGAIAELYDSNNKLQVWDVDELKRVLVLVGHEATVCCVAADETKVRYHLNLCALNILHTHSLSQHFALSGHCTQSHACHVITQ